MASWTIIIAWKLWVLLYFSLLRAKPSGEGEDIIKKLKKEKFYPTAIVGIS